MKSTEIIMKSEEISNFLRTFVISKLDGNRIIADQVGFSYMSEVRKLSKQGVETPETEFIVFSFEKPTYLDDFDRDISYQDIFAFLPGNWNQKWTSQDQIIEIVNIFRKQNDQDFNIVFLCKLSEQDIIDEDNPYSNSALVFCNRGREDEETFNEIAIREMRSLFYCIGRYCDPGKEILPELRFICPKV